jgi:uncharacterized protein DUF6599
MKTPLLFLLAVLLAAVPAAAADLNPDCAAVPGWSQKGDVRVHVPDDLFDYMNGNAEGYIIYGFEKMTGVTCISADRTIHIDYFKMASPEMSWGIFTANRHPRHDTAAIGIIGQVMPRRATFAKGSYYVEFAANQDNLEALDAFTKAIEPKVPGATDAPAALTWFPKEGLDAASVRLVPQSVMGLRLLKRGYLAKYDDGRAFIVTEESPEAAAAVLAQLKERLSDPSAGDVGDASITGKDRYLGQMYLAQKGSYLIGFATRNADADLAARVRAVTKSIP